MSPVSVQVITYAPTVFSHCQHCELTFQEMGIGQRLRRQESAESLPDDLARDYAALSQWVHDLLARHRTNVRVRVIDAASIEGFVASIRHRVGRYPALILDGRRVDIEPGYAAAEALIDARVASSSAGRPSRPDAHAEEVIGRTR